MPGTKDRNETFPLPVIESGKIYAPGSLAKRILNLQVTTDGTLRSVRGPCLYMPTYPGWAGFTGARMYGIYHAALMAGMSDMLLARYGGTLYRHQGWSRTWTALQTGLNHEGRQKFADQFCEVNGRIIWTNGVDRALVIDSDGNTYPLGYDRAPAAPSVLGPTRPETPDEDYPNSSGYSHPGDLGTLGNALNGQVGSMLEGAWYWYAQWEDLAGNLSPLSGPSNAGLVWTQSVGYSRPGSGSAFGNDFDELDDMPRQFLVRGIQAGPARTAAILLWRTRDNRHNPQEVFFRARIPGNADLMFPDSLSDALLGQPAIDLVPVPHFKVMTPWQGGLAIANTTDNPGLVRLSERGFPGMYRRDRWIIPDPSGGEVTALASHRGILLAFTEAAVYAISEGSLGLSSTPLSRTIGCVAPRSIQALPDGSLIWLGRDGFYLMGNSGPERWVEDIEDDVARINWARAGRAVSVYNPVTHEYICVTRRDSQDLQRWMFVYDTRYGGWRAQDHQMGYDDLCATNDWRRYVLGVGRNLADSRDDVWVLDHETRNYTPPAKTYRFESVELRADPAGMKRMHAKALYLGLVESDSAGTATITVYRDMRAADTSTATVNLRDDDYATTWSFSTAVIGTTTAKVPKLFWRRIPLDIQNCHSFRFRIDATEPVHLHIAAFAFDAQILDRAGSRVPGPI